MGLWTDKRFCGRRLKNIAAEGLLMYSLLRLVWMRIKRTAAVALLVASGLLLIPFSEGSNCGGNSAALNDVKWYSLIVQLAAEENPDHEFRIDCATPNQREELAHIANDFWVSGARFLVSTRPYRLQSTAPPRLLIVCDRAYRNVPRRLIGSAQPTHAAAFSDGSCRLLSEAEFEAIDRSVLVPLQELLADGE